MSIDPTSRPDLAAMRARLDALEDAISQVGATLAQLDAGITDRPMVYTALVLAGRHLAAHRSLLTAVAPAPAPRRRTTVIIPFPSPITARMACHV